MIFFILSVISQSSTTSNISWSLTDGATAIYKLCHLLLHTQCFFASDDITGITEGLQEGTEYSLTVTATLSITIILITTASTGELMPF